MDYADQIWSLLDDALSAIFAGRRIPHSLEELYRGVENICRQKQAAELFEKMKARLQAYLDAQIKRPLLEAAKMLPGGQARHLNVELLNLMHVSWLDWNTKLVM